MSISYFILITEGSYLRVHWKLVSGVQFGSYYVFYNTKSVLLNYNIGKYCQYWSSIRCMIVVYTWYDQAEKVETDGTDSHMSVHEEGQYAHTIE